MRFRLISPLNSVYRRMSKSLEDFLNGPSLVEPVKSSALQLSAASRVLDDATTALLHVGSSVDPIAAEDGLRMLAALHTTDPEQLCATILHPSFRYWLQALKRYDG